MATDNFDSFAETCERFVNIAQYDAAHLDVGGAFHRLAELHEREIAELHRRLNVAEDALTAAIGTSCAGCKQDCDGCLNLKNGWMKNAKKALAAIRAKGGEDGK